MRADIDPRGIEPLISSAFIARTHRARCGAAAGRGDGPLTDLMGMRGARDAAHHAASCPRIATRFAERLVDLFDGPAILRLSLTSRRGLRTAGARRRR
ncbi:MAG: hypothetical protein U5K36_11120 [Roseovarius sp.]|nr:hypothetical protein [Roseovarius sp.]